MTFFLLAAGFCLLPGGGDFSLSAQSAGSHAELGNYIFPQYREKDQRLQSVIFGRKAVNQGAYIFLTDAIIDLVEPHIRELALVNPLPSVEMQPYPMLETGEQAFQAFWADKSHASALIFSEKATYDKTVSTLSSDELVHFRSRDLDLDGVGFDAYLEKRLIHVRSAVKVVIRPEARRNARKGSAGGTRSETEKEFDEMQKKLTDEISRGNEEEEEAVL